METNIIKPFIKGNIPQFKLAAKDFRLNIAGDQIQITIFKLPDQL